MFNDKLEICYATVFIDNKSKNVFCEFQHAPGEAETVKAKQAMEREAMKSNVKHNHFVLTMEFSNQ